MRRDREHPPAPRSILGSRRLEVGGIGFGFVREDVARPTDWCFHEPHHIVVLHRHGRLKTMEMEFEDGPSGRLLPDPGQVWVIPAEQRYAALAHGSTVEFTELSVPTRLLGDRAVPANVGLRDPFLFFACARIGSLASRTDTASRLFRETLADAITLHLRDSYSRGGRPDGPANREFDTTTRQRIAEYLDAELDTDISLARLADLVDMSVGSFTKAFVAAFGATPYQYVLDRRIKKAKQLLAATSTPVADIGAAVGFSTPSHFTTTFRRRVGVTPTVYRTDWR